MDIFVVGVTGLLGRKAVGLLVSQGHTVRAAAQGLEERAIARDLGAEPIEVDLFDADALRRAVAGADAVLRLATHIPEGRQVRRRKAWRENDRLRRDVSRALVDAAIAEGVPVYVQESVTFLYADAGERWIDEDWPVEPAWVNLPSALDAEREAERFTASGRRGVSLRLGFLYASYSALSRTSIDLSRDRRFPVLGEGVNFLPSIHVDDAAAAVVAALGAPAGAFNVVDDEPLRQGEMARVVARAFGYAEPRRIPRWVARLALGGPASAVLRSNRASNARFKAATGWAPRYPSAREGWTAIAEELSGEVRPRIEA